MRQPRPASRPTQSTLPELPAAVLSAFMLGGAQAVPQLARALGLRYDTRYRCPGCDGHGITGDPHNGKPIERCRTCDGTKGVRIGTSGLEPVMRWKMEGQ